MEIVRCPIRDLFPEIPRTARLLNGGDPFQNILSRTRLQAGEPAHSPQVLHLVPVIVAREFVETKNIGLFKAGRQVD
ncbi:MAG: hypothetical protein Tsb009_10560 [Planctomycetaceae bacterium]